MGVPDTSTMLVQVDFEVFGHVQGEHFLGCKKNRTKHIVQSVHCKTI